MDYSKIRDKYKNKDKPIKNSNKEKDMVKKYNKKIDRGDKSSYTLPYSLNFEENSGVITDNEYEVKSEYEK